MTIYNTIYKITNNINGKIYIGMHKTKDLDDSYMGSGFLIKRAINHHGKENFTKEILFVFDTYEEMLEKESELVTEEFVNDPMTYNLVCGGRGWDVGNYVVENNLGIHALTFEQRSEFSKINQKNRCQIERSLMCYKGGKIGGSISRNNKSGIFSFSDKQRKATSEKAIEKQRSEKLARFNSEYQSKLGQKGGPKNKGFKWYNDGQNDYKYTVKEQGELGFIEFLNQNQEFKSGRIGKEYKPRPKQKGKISVTDGRTNMMLPLNEGMIFLDENPTFKRGRTNFK